MCLQKSKITLEDMKRKETSKNIFSITLFVKIFILIDVTCNILQLQIFYDIIVKEMAE